MSAPDTNAMEQARQHRAPIVAMLGVVLFALTLFFGLKAYYFDQADDSMAPRIVQPDPSAVLKRPEPVRAPEASLGHKPDTTPAEAYGSVRRQSDGAGQAAGAAADE